MINTPERLRIPTKGKHSLDVIVNWNDDAENCQFVKLRVDNSYDIIVSRASFIRAALLIGNEEEQESLIPTKTIPVKQIRKTYTVRLTKPMNEGETITIPIELDIPLIADDDLPSVAQLEKI